MINARLNGMAFVICFESCVPTRPGVRLCAHGCVTAGVHALQQDDLTINL